MASGEGGLGEAEGFEQATDGFPDELSLLAYLDLAGLVELGEREGLGRGPGLRAASPPRSAGCEAVGLAVQSSRTSCPRTPR